MLKLAGLSGTAAALALSGCATTYAGDAEPRPVTQICDAGSAQSSVGAKATAELGASLMVQTGARSLRWLPPRSAMTTDYGQDRLNIEYGDDYTINRIFCG